MLSRRTAAGARGGRHDGGRGPGLRRHGIFGYAEGGQVFDNLYMLTTKVEQRVGSEDFRGSFSSIRFTVTPHRTK